MTFASNRPSSLVVDIQALQRRINPDRGIPRYITGQIREVLKRGVIHSLNLNPSRPFPKNLNLEILNSGLLHWGGAPVLRNAHASGQLLYWITSAFEPEASIDSIIPRWLVAEHGRIIVTLYDLIPLLFEPDYPTSPAARGLHSRALDVVKMADLVLTISDSTRADALKHLNLSPEKVVSVGGAVNAFFNPEDDVADDLSLITTNLAQLKRPFLFTVLGNDRRKNVEKLLDAYSQLPESVRGTYSLVIGGYSPESNLEPGILVLPRVTDRVLRALYRQCSLFVFPSKYEGFGLAAAEAMACGAPTVVSDRSSLPELVLDERARFNPEDASEMADCIHRALLDADVRDGLKSAALRSVNCHRWEHVAEKTIGAISLLASPKSNHRRAQPKPAIGFAGPFPPVRSGIATYNLQVIRALSRIADLVVLYTGECDVRALHEAGVAEAYPVTSLGKSFAPWFLDGLLYSFGNSAHHLDTFDKVFEFPGLLWLHDVDLIEFHDAYFQTRSPENGEGLKNEVFRMYGHRSPPPVTAGEPFGLDPLRNWGVRLTSKLVDASLGVIVSSTHALEMLRLDQPPGGRMPPSWLIPLAIRSMQDPVKSREEKPPVIATFGIVGDDKAPDVLIDAVALLPPSLEAQLCFVGSADRECERKLQRRASEKLVSHQVKITGFVSETEWFEHIRSATCAVQLRTKSRGESSAGVMDCLALGLPVITNIVSCGDLPDDAVFKVAPDISASALKDALLHMITDRDAWGTLHRGALRYAQDHSFEITAARIVDVVMNTAKERFRAPTTKF